MVEFQFGLFNNADYTMINSISDAIRMLTDGQGFGIGAQFHNVSKPKSTGWKFRQTVCITSIRTKVVL